MTRSHRICVLPGDGIGPEVTAAALAVLAEAGTAHRPNRSSSNPPARVLAGGPRGAGRGWFVPGASA